MSGDGNTSEDTTTFAYLCIGCPLGCRLEVDEDSHGDIVEIRGIILPEGRPVRSAGTHRPPPAVSPPPSRSLVGCGPDSRSRPPGRSPRARFWPPAKSFEVCGCKHR